MRPTEYLTAREGDAMPESYLKIQCNNCQRIMRAPATLAGKQCRCPGCKHTIAICDVQRPPMPPGPPNPAPRWRDNTPARKEPLVDLWPDNAPAGVTNPAPIAVTPSVPEPPQPPWYRTLANRISSKCRQLGGTIAKTASHPQIPAIGNLADRKWQITISGRTLGIAASCMVAAMIVFYSGRVYERRVMLRRLENGAEAMRMTFEAMRGEKPKLPGDEQPR